MNSLNFDKPCSIHFIGIGGISMSGLAQILLSRGFKVSGSDANESELTRELAAKGIEVHYSHSASNIGKDVEIVVYTAAIKDDNVELIAAYDRRLPVVTRAGLLGYVMENYRTAIAVSGTHGKTTTTSMIAECLVGTDMDPTVTVGGMLDLIGGNLRLGAGDVFLTEACEYMNSFLEFQPSIGVILNIEEDHLDFFKDIDDIRHSFGRFAGIIREGGKLVINSSIPNYKKILSDTRAEIITVGRDDESDYYARNISLDSNACASFDLYYKKRPMASIRLSVAGEYNVDNAMAAIAACIAAGMDADTVIEIVSRFTGVHRRFERKGEVNGITIIDDYAHHPTEIAATLGAARSTGHNELWVAFQPHTYTRTKALFDDFVAELSKADHIIITDIYAAREKNTVGISSQMLVDALKRKNADAYYIGSFKEIEDFALKKCKKNDMFITMGAGNVVDIANSIIKR